MNIKLLIICLCLLLFCSRSILAADAVHAECKRIANKLASVSIDECLDTQLVESDGRSVKDAPILIKEYRPLLEKRKPSGRVLLLGGIHGDEYASVTIIFKWMRALDQYHSGQFHWLIVPLLNPDGLLQKNSERINANGIDLDRNFPTPDWETESRHYWEELTHRNPLRYPGESALSEPESRWLVDMINRFKPDVIMSVHAPHEVVDFNTSRNEPYKLARLYLNLPGTYPGSLGRYAGVQEQIPVVTIELPYAGIMPKPSEVNTMWEDLLGWLTEHLPVDQSGVLTAEQESYN